MQILLANGQPLVRGPVRDAVSARADVSAGAVAAVPVSAGLESTTVQVTVNDRAATVVSFQGGELQFRVPSELAPGPAVVRVSVGGVAAPPVVMQVDLPPPEITLVTAAGARIDATRAARPGELLSVAVKGLAEPGAEVGLSRVKVMVGLSPQQVLLVTRQDGAHVVHFNLDTATPVGSQPLVIVVDGRESAPFALAVRAAS
jgi:uncharacterized protein (TIGR03437 family)